MTPTPDPAPLTAEPLPLSAAAKAFDREFHEDWDTRCGPDCPFIGALIAEAAARAPSQPDLREALERIERPGCEASRWHGEEPPVWDRCLDYEYVEEQPTGDPKVDRCGPCQAHAALAAIGLAIPGAVSPTITIGNDADGARADVRQSGIEPFGTGLGDMVGSPRSESSGASHPTSVGAGHGPLAADSDGHAALGASSRFHETSVTDESMPAPADPHLGCQFNHEHRWPECYDDTAPDPAAVTEPEETAPASEPDAP